MIIRINKQDNTPLYRQICQQVRQLIRDGQLQPGQLLPSLNQLAIMLDISRETTKKAYNQLLREGLLIAQQGKGIFVAGRRETDKKEILLILDKQSVYNQILVQAFQDTLQDSVHITILLHSQNLDVLEYYLNQHLDRYDYNMQNYVNAKMRIIRNQTTDDSFIFWEDDPIIARELKKYDIKSHLCPFSAIKEHGAIAYISDGHYEIEYPTPINMEEEELALTGRHNIYNQLAAGISANVMGVNGKVIVESLKNFQGVPHRLEKVAKVRGVQYVNDSKATNVNACFFALESMKTPTVLILGGTDKGNDYNEILPLVKEKCRALVFLGADNKKLHDFFGPVGIPIADTHSMADCVKACYEFAQPGDTVLLSPCCASFDLFKNMADRGNQFKELVCKL